MTLPKRSKREDFMKGFINNGEATIQTGELSFVKAERDYYKAVAEFAISALETYADEGFYHGCAFAFDRPTGGFDEDFSEEPDSDYSYPKPGNAARQALEAIRQTEGPT